MDLTTRGDACLLELSRDQDPSALETLLERHAPTAFAVAFAILGNREDARDAAQEALVRLALEVRRGGAQTGFKRCVYTAAFRAAIDLRRQSASRKKREQEVAQAHAQESSAVSASAEQQETLSILREELAQLPEEAAVALSLFHLQELSVAETAQQLGTTEAACKMRLSRGREELASRLRRRGVSQASVVLLGGLLETLFQQSRASAGEAEPGAWPNAARAAVGAATAVAVAGSIGQSASVTDGRQWQPARRSTTARSGVVLAAAVLALLAMLIGVVQMVSARSRPSTGGRVGAATREAPGASAPARAPDRSAATPVSDAAQTPLPTAPERAGNGGPPAAARAAAAEWQAPRVVNAHLIPHASSTCGRYGAILAADYLVLTDVPRDLVVLTTEDFGATWKMSKALHGYADGAISVDAQGNCSILAVPVSKQFSVDPQPQLDVYTRSLTGDFVRQPTTLSSTGDGFIHSPSLLAAPGALWAANAERNGDVCVATGTTIEHLTAVARVKPEKNALNRWAIYTHGLAGDLNGDVHLSLWARDAACAGIVVPEDSGKKILLISTRDGGSGWLTTEIPFQGLATSETTDLRAEPLCVQCMGERLVLVLRVLNYNAAAKTHPVISRVCVITSPDLGKSWEAPHYFGEPEFIADTDLLRGTFNLCVVNNRVWVSQDRIFEGTPEARALLARYEAGEPLQIGLLPSCGWTTHATMYQSSDWGATWERNSSCDTSPGTGNCILFGSDGQTAHACWMVDTDQSRHYQLAIRTLSTHPLPAAKLPDGFTPPGAAVSKPAKSPDF